MAGSLNSDTLARADQAIAAVWPSVDRAIAAADAALAGAHGEVSAAQEELQGSHATQEAAYLDLQQKNQEAVQAVQARSAAEREAGAVEDLARQRDAAAAELQRLQEERKALKTEYLLTRDRIADLREGVAARLQREAGAKVRVRVLRNADGLEYQEKLLGALHGSGLKNQEEIIRTLARMRPEDLAQILRDDDLAELEAHASFGRERGRKILDALRKGLDALALEILPIEDRVCIELNVSSSGPANFKDAAELSRGQKCTALLPILLARRDSPLLMNSDGRRGYVEKAGSVDECRREIIDLLEGGEEAFELRRKRYVG